jgi:predicted Fe-Mo cluster-binding NifX family protein
MMLIGVTSQNFKTITKHAAKTRRFIIYSVDENEQIEETKRLDLPIEESLKEYDRKAIHPIYAVDVLLTGSCGDKFKKRLKRFDVEVVETDEADPLHAIKAYRADMASQTH